MRACTPVLGDGELDEGAVWEAAASAVKFGLDNLTAIVDWNKVQLDGTTDEIMPLRDLPGKWKAFGWNVLRCDGTISRRSMPRSMRLWPARAYRL